MKVYLGTNLGTFDPTPTTFSPPIDARHMTFAQLDKEILNTSDKYDLVTVFNGTIFVRLNDNAGGFGNAVNLGWGTNTSDDIHVAIADMNSDGYNDIVAVGSVSATKTARVYLNSADGHGTFTTISWEFTGTTVPTNAQVALGELGSPSSAGKNDRLNDIALVGDAGQIKIFINQGGGTFAPTPNQSFTAGSGSVNKARLADIRNDGGMSLIYARGSDVFINQRAVNPAPAPPRNPSWQPSGVNPMITWTANTEPDVAGYNVYKKASGTPSFILAATVGLTQTSWIDVNEMYTYNETTLYNEYYIKAYDNATNLSDQSATVSVPIIGNAWKLSANGEQLPSAFALHQNYPNPFNPSTEIKFDLLEDGFVSLNVFDVLGRKVGELVNGNYAAGYHTATWNANNISSGVYFARFTATDASGIVKLSKVNKLLLAK